MIHWGGRSLCSSWPKRPEPAWAPSDLGASLLGWWDAEVPSTLSLTGSAVNSWTDLVGGYVASQGTAAAKPAWAATSFQGRPGITFDGTADFLSRVGSPFPTGATPAEYWALVSQDAIVSDATTRRAFATGNTNAGRGVAYSGGGGQFRLLAYVGTGAGSTFTPQVNGFTGYHVVRAQFLANGASVSMDNGTAQTSASVTPASSTTNLGIGVGEGLASGFWSGSINSIVVTGALTASQAASLYAFLSSRI